jgi:hypothetical protein
MTWAHSVAHQKISLFHESSPKAFSQVTNQYIFFTLGRFYEKGSAHSL